MKDTLGIPIKLSHIGWVHQSEGSGKK
jgi:hypothetical protein